MGYYGMSGIPDVVFDGVQHLVGAGSGHVDGTIYANVIDDRLLQTAPLNVAIAGYSYDLSDPFVTVQVEVFEEIASIANTYIRIGLCEDGLSYSGTNYHNVLRDMLTQTPLTVSQVGEIQEVTLPLSLNGGWDPEELWLWAIVQRDSDKAIINAGSTKGGPYGVSVGVDGARQVILDGPHMFGNTVLMNVGTEPDVYDLTLDEAYLSDGWSSYFTIDGVDYTETSVSLAPLETVTVNVTMVPNEDLGSGSAYLFIHSQSEAIPDKAIGFAGLTSGTDLLVVADDGDAGYGYDFYAPALATTGMSFAVWERGFSAITAATMSDYDAIVWFSSLEEANLDADDRTQIEQFLNDGGRLFLAGQTVARSIIDDDGNSWLMNVLKTLFQHWLTGDPTVSGVAGDPIADGLELDLVGGDGAGNYDAPDVIAPFGDGGTKAFNFTGTTNGCGNRVEYDECKIVFLGFGFESVNSADDRNLLMQRVIDWLVPGSTSVTDGQLPQQAALYQNVPNPFNPQTTIAFSLPQESHVRVEVYDMTGRLVRVLADEMRTSGEHSVIWDGRDSAGSRVASGTYFCKMSSDDSAFSRKMTMLK